MARRWFRVYAEIRDDLKILSLDEGQRWLWVALLATVAETAELGVVPSAPRHALAAALHTTEERLNEALSAFAAQDMVECRADGSILVTHFAQRQYESPSAEPQRVRERVRRHRDRAVGSGAATATAPAADVTPMKRAGNALYTDTDTDTDTEIKAGRPRARAREHAACDPATPPPPLPDGTSESGAPPEPGATAGTQTAHAAGATPAAATPDPDPVRGPEPEPGVDGPPALSAAGRDAVTRAFGRAPPAGEIASWAALERRCRNAGRATLFGEALAHAGERSPRDPVRYVARVILSCLRDGSRPGGTRRAGAGASAQGPPARAPAEPARYAQHTAQALAEAEAMARGPDDPELRAALAWLTGTG